MVDSHKTGSNPPASPEAEVVRHWYAAYTRSSHEAKVKKHLGVRGIESYLPEYQVVHRWKNRCTKRLELPLFPGYIFVHIAPGERVRVLEVPGVLLLVGKAGTPVPLPDSDMEALREGLHARKARPHPYLNVGERARIKSGALAGLEGVITRSNNSLRVIISMELLMQSVAVEVEWGELEPVGARR